ncbi:MAG: type I restriction enzyme endonuclease domain-containing protein [Pseudonocardiaceae bacterium]
MEVTRVGVQAHTDDHVPIGARASGSVVCGVGGDRERRLGLAEQAGEGGPDVVRLLLDLAGVLAQGPRDLLDVVDLAEHPESLGDLLVGRVDLATVHAAARGESAERARIEQSVAVVNAVYGAPARLATLAEDIVAQWEIRRDRMRPFIESTGKAMIVCATREICANLYAAIIALRPDWHCDDVGKGRIKVVYSGTPSDTPPVVHHVRRDSQNAAIKERLRNVDDELEIVIVKDMMLTGYDSPPLHTLYLDRPLKGALLMQTLARVNRTYRGKEDGLLVAYAPLADNLRTFYDAVAQNESAVAEQGEDVLAKIARELVSVMRRDVRTDWTVRDDVRAKLRSSIRRLLIKHGYPPDKQPGAIKLVLEQMESMAPRYAAERT